MDCIVHGVAKSWTQLSGFHLATLVLKEIKPEYSLEGLKLKLQCLEGQGNLACCSPWGCKELDTTEQLNNKSMVTMQN